MRRHPILTIAFAACVLAPLTACSSTASAPPTGTAPAPSASASDPTITTMSATSSTPTASTPAGSASASPQPSASAAAPADPNRPAGQCADADLKVVVQKYGIAATHTIWQFLFTNTGSSSCRLRGYPGVSVVGHGDGTQLGVPATRDPHGQVATVTLEPGESNVNALLSVVDVDHDGGALGGKCPTAAADGWRVYPPHSTRAVFIRADGLRACTGSTTWMSVLPVGDNPK